MTEQSNRLDTGRRRQFVLLIRVATSAALLFMLLSWGEAQAVLDHVRRLSTMGIALVWGWFAVPVIVWSVVYDLFTVLTKKNADSTWDHACLPPLQFQIEQLFTIHRPERAQIGNR